MLGIAVFLGWCLGLGAWAWFVEKQNKERLEKLHQECEKQIKHCENFKFWGC